MPRKATQKRPGDDAGTQPPQGSSATKKAKADTSQTDGQPVLAWTDHTSKPTARRIPRGANGEVFMPSVMPAECADVIEKVPMPNWWVRSIDAIPGRAMTLGSRKWWEEHGEWLEANKKALKLKAKDWAKREEVMLKPDELKEDEGNHDWDFVCAFAPRGIDDDDEDEDHEDEDEDDEDEDDPEEETDGEKADEPKKSKGDPGPIGKLASLHPSHPWSFSMKGKDRGDWWTLETIKRDQDAFDLHFYNDFSVYGCMEVMENMVAHFAKVLKPDADYRDIWSEIEGVAMFLQSEVANLSTCDDPERLGKLVALFGHMVLSGLRHVKKQGQLKPGGSIPNLGLVFSMLSNGGWIMQDFILQPEKEISWVFAILDMAKEAGIQVTGVPDYESTLAEIEDQRDEYYTPGTRSIWSKDSFRTKLKSYGGKGGHHYDITMMTGPQRKKGSLSRHIF